MRRMTILLLAVLSLWGTPALAAPPMTINFQGYLASGAASPVNATVSMVFKLWDAASGGTALWTETQPSVAVTNGVFNVVLGSVTPIPLAFDAPYYLGVAAGGDAEMTPRQALAASPYAFRAANADALASTAAVAGSQITGTIGTAQIADNAVTRAKLSAVGGASGQVLGTNGADLLWQAPPIVLLAGATDQSVGMGDYVGLGTSSSTFLRNAVVISRSAVVSKLTFSTRSTMPNTMIAAQLWYQPMLGLAAATPLTALIADGSVEQFGLAAGNFPVNPGDLIAVRITWVTGGALTQGLTWSIEMQ